MSQLQNRGPFVLMYCKLVSLFSKNFYTFACLNFLLLLLGGTFDIIHTRPSYTLLSHSFKISNKVIIGLTSDELAEKKGKTPTVINMQKRFENLKTIISKEFPNPSFQISNLNNDFGPAVLDKGVEALVVSDETSNQGKY